MATGKVKWYDAKREYGFIEVDGIEDVFIHSSAISDAKFKILHEGDIVEFDIVPDRKGPRAENITVLEKKEETNENI